MELSGRHSFSISSGQTTLSKAAQLDPATILDDKALLRGVSASTLMANYGILLAKPQSGWQYEMGRMESAALYANSHEVDSIKWFISHSWRDGRLHKYIAIAWVLNRKIALAAAHIVSSLCVLAELSRGVDRQRFSFVGYVYILTFMVFLLNVTQLRKYSRDTTFFLDKACIHQTDPVLKAQGISSLGGFLRESQRLLVLWSPDYFERLWCNYEIASFISLVGLENVHVVPLWMPMITITLLMLYALDHICNYLLMIGYALSAFYLTLPKLSVLPIVGITWLRASKLRVVLQHQLAKFSFENSRCYCCDVGHELPGSGTRISCDRVQIRESINNWFREFARAEDNDAVQAFERCVREHLGRRVRDLLGPTLMPISAWTTIAGLRFWVTVEACIIHYTDFDSRLSAILVDTFETLDWFLLDLMLVVYLKWRDTARHQKVRDAVCGVTCIVLFIFNRHVVEVSIRSLFA